MTVNTPWHLHQGKDGNLSFGMVKNISGFLKPSELGLKSISKLKLDGLLFIIIVVNIIIWETQSVGWMIMRKEGHNWLGTGIKGIMLLCMSFSLLSECLLMISVAYIDEKVTSGDH
jgi:hypothetical protein